MFKITCIFLCSLFSELFVTTQAQYLSNLHATAHDALYTTYAAPPERSHYRSDQGYQLQWFDEQSGTGFISSDGPNFGLAFSVKNRLIYNPGSMHQEPVVTASYSDLVRFYCYPEKGIRVEAFFAVYSSETAFAEYTIKNETHFPANFNVYPWFYYPAGDSSAIPVRKDADFYSFKLNKMKDGWMKEHTIPIIENFNGEWSLSGLNSSGGIVFCRNTHAEEKLTREDNLDDLINSFLLVKRKKTFIHGVIRSRAMTMQPGDETTFRIIIRLNPLDNQSSRAISEKSADVSEIIPDSLVKADERAYSKIPVLEFHDENRKLMFWSAFSLMRQCMMPPEGECRHNYYVFSREPRWGWGYGGQVFHESLTMPALAYMNPESAMNSQRIYFDRQRKDGYINYRTGPYLNETIETNGKSTSSAPWFNFQNLEIFKITGDKSFLAEAYTSGKAFYRFYTASRDSNQNGLCEWGAHAELESVRDARVAVWDQVGWASNFEGPDVNSMLVKEAASLQEMATILGFTSEARAFEMEAEKRKNQVNQTMWDSETGFYYNINRNDQTFTFRKQDDLKIKEIIGFLPLWAGIPDREQARKLVTHLTDTNSFRRPFGIPSLSAEEKYYCPIGYWNGPVWIQWNYLIYRGLKDYGYYDLSRHLSERILDQVQYHLSKDHTFWEFYSADDRQAGWNRTYIWAGLVSRFIIDDQVNSEN